MRGPAHERHFMRRDHSPVAGVRKGGQRPDQGVGMTLGMVLAWCWVWLGCGVGVTWVTNRSQQSSIQIEINDL